jgi:DNA-3-methyladenine glycosylase I
MTRAAKRCAWAESDPLLSRYHDREWGMPEFDGRALWEMLMLEGFQAGLAWITVLRKRDAFRRAFHDFDPAAVARLNQKQIARLLNNPGIIRSRAKIEATIGGARAYLEMEKNGQRFADFVWNFVDGRPIQNVGPVPVTTGLAEKISRELKRRGFKFVGPTIVYAWMQATGMVNDHAQDCFRRSICARLPRQPS